VIGYNPSPDAIGNLTVITSNAGAEYGNVNGGDVIAVLKSGTNQLHGSAFAFLENYNLDADTWPSSSPAIRASPSPRLSSAVPSSAISSSSSSLTMREPAITRAAPRPHPSFRRPFVLAASRAANAVHSLCVRRRSGSLRQQSGTHHQSGCTISLPELYPLPNKPGTDSLGIQNNYIGTYRNTVRNDQGDVKIDYSLSKHDTIMARYSQGEASDATPRRPSPSPSPEPTAIPSRESR
jgi:hypothetical protein